LSGPYLKPLLGRGRPVWVMGAYDVLSARIVERAGFDAVGVQSLQLAFANGLPDIGSSRPTSRPGLPQDPRAVSCRSSSTSAGLRRAVRRRYWMKELEAAGVAAVHIDDYGLPYKCQFIRHVLGLEDVDGTADKIQAMVGEKTTRTSW
jgi:2-methylisocitrate lyase-like PEP mutase family enzyme